MWSGIILCNDVRQRGGGGKAGQTCFFLCSLNLFLPSEKFLAASLRLSSASRSAISCFLSASCCLEKNNHYGLSTIQIFFRIREKYRPFHITNSCDKPAILESHTKIIFQANFQLVGMLLHLIVSISSFPSPIEAGTYTWWFVSYRGVSGGSVPWVACKLLFFTGVLKMRQNSVRVCVRGAYSAFAMARASTCDEEEDDDFETETSGVSCTAILS